MDAKETIIQEQKERKEEVKTRIEICMRLIMNSNDRESLKSNYDKLHWYLKGLFDAGFIDGKTFQNNIQVARDLRRDTLNRIKIQDEIQNEIDNIFKIIFG